MKAAVAAAALGLGAAWLWQRSKARGLQPLQGTFAPSVEITQDAKKSSPTYERNQNFIKKLAAFCPGALKFLGSVDTNAAEKAALACGIVGDINDPEFFRKACEKYVSGKISGTLGDGRSGAEELSAKFGCEQAMETFGDIVGENFVAGEATRIAGISLACAAAAGPVAGVACFGAASFEAALSGRGGPTLECLTKVGPEEWAPAPCGTSKCDDAKYGRGPLYSFYNSQTGRMTTPLEKGPKFMFNAFGVPTGTGGETYYLSERDEETCRWIKREATQREIELYGQ